MTLLKLFYAFCIGLMILQITLVAWLLTHPPKGQ